MRLPSRLLAALLLAVAALIGCQGTGPVALGNATAAQAPAEMRQVLAPAGVLRIAVYPGSPTSLVRRPGSDEAPAQIS
jgi:polar amino acid transport system substrate-binding protein